MSSKHKRDRIQIIAEILGTCRSPQTQTYIRRQTNISYEVLQKCIMHLLLKQWLLEVESDLGQRKLAITDKGILFLIKWLELQRLVGLKSKSIPFIPLSELKTVKKAK